MTLKRKLLALALGCGLLLVADQVFLYAALADGSFLGRRIAPFSPPLFHEQQERSLERLRQMATGDYQRSERFDTDLGWICGAGTGTGDWEYDWAGCRIGFAELDRVKRPGVRRIVVVGGSFVRGDEVGAKECWPALLGNAREDIEVANLGVGAYGSDQAFLRWRRDGKPLDADEVWLGFMPQASLRCLSIYRPALRHWSPSVAFKPRFLVGPDGELVLRPLPVRTPLEAIAAVQDPMLFLQAVGRDDFWVERCRPAYLEPGAHWTHYTAAGRVLLTLEENQGRAAEPYLRDPDGELARLIPAIALKMREEVEATGARFRFLVLHGPDAMAQRGNTWGTNVLGPLHEAGVEILDVSSELWGAPDSWWMPGGHYAPPAHEKIAARFLAELERD